MWYTSESLYCVLHHWILGTVWYTSESLYCVLHHWILVLCGTPVNPCTVCYTIGSLYCVLHHWILVWCATPLDPCMMWYTNGSLLCALHQSIIALSYSVLYGLSLAWPVIPITYYMFALYTFQYHCALSLQTKRSDQVE